MGNFQSICEKKTTDEEYIVKKCDSSAYLTSLIKSSYQLLALRMIKNTIFGRQQKIQVNHNSTIISNRLFSDVEEFIDFSIPEGNIVIEERGVRDGFHSPQSQSCQMILEGCVSEQVQAASPKTTPKINDELKVRQKMEAILNLIKYRNVNTQLFEDLKQLSSIYNFRQNKKWIPFLDSFKQTQGQTQVILLRFLEIFKKQLNKSLTVFNPIWLLDISPLLSRIYKYFSNRSRGVNLKLFSSKMNFECSLRIGKEYLSNYKKGSTLTFTNFVKFSSKITQFKECNLQLSLQIPKQEQEKLIFLSLQNESRKQVNEIFLFPWQQFQVQEVFYDHFCQINRVKLKLLNSESLKRMFEIENDPKEEKKLKNGKNFQQLLLDKENHLMDIINQDKRLFHKVNDGVGLKVTEKIDILNDIEQKIQLVNQKTYNQSEETGQIQCTTKSQSQSAETGTKDIQTEQDGSLNKQQFYQFYQKYIGVGDEQAIQEKAKSIQIISLGWKNIQRITSMEHFAGLKELYLQNNLISRIEGFNRPNNLEKLNLNYNFIECLEGLDKLDHLRSLHVIHNRLTITSSIYLIQTRNCWQGLTSLQISFHNDQINKNVQSYRIIMNDDKKWLQLRQLTIENCDKLGEEGLEEVIQWGKKKQPSCNIIYWYF